MRILLTGGGTGGHLFPLLAVVKALKKESKEPLNIAYLGPRNKLSEEIFSKEEIKTRKVFT